MFDPCNFINGAVRGWFDRVTKIEQLTMQLCFELNKLKIHRAINLGKLPIIATAEISLGLRNQWDLLHWEDNLSSLLRFTTECNSLETGKRTDGRKQDFKRNCTYRYNSLCHPLHILTNIYSCRNHEYSHTGHERCRNMSPFDIRLHLI